MPNPPQDVPESHSDEVSQADRIDRICDAYERAWIDGGQPQLEDYVASASPAVEEDLRRELNAIRSDYEQRRSGGQTPEYDETFRPDTPDANRDPRQHPARIDRYQIQKLLGKGGFGHVYLAYDAQLQRLVAIKVPHTELVSRTGDAQAYLEEARTVANLDHPSIVPVYNVGSDDHYPCYVVTKYIEGMDLAARIKKRPLKYRAAAELVATVAEALHYAHKQGLVHRDVKPGNILIGSEDQPFLADFGLALKEENAGKGPGYAGTPAYMSPEQARGEGHRMDGRSDVFSLGVVLYELLSGRRPFRGDTQAELLEQVTRYEPRPLRQYDERLPKELQRICHKAMAKRASERYLSAHDMAEDLRLFLAEQTLVQNSTSPGGVTPVGSMSYASAPASTSVDSLAAASASLNSGSADTQPIRIVPKGLRSFDAHDADFFLELLPGPRDRNGLPDSLRFWKTRIEETDPDHTFSVGLIYGPSGCGKSSLVKAGLLPRLSEDVIPVYIEATPEETETRLLHGLRRRCPTLEDHLSLKDTLAALRRGQGIPVGRKVLIILDQFEQWLHANKEVENTDLVQALRQCDGSRVQCIVMVRDDFWMAATRFMRDLEVRLVEAQNSAAVDLFLIRHAEKVLAAFGRAFGTLPDDSRETSKKQKEFLKQSVAGLAEEGRVICVRLALFAEMMKGKTWTPATLKKVGGTKGVGVTFLEETFSASTSPPEHRYHQRAARAVLKDLLPDSGSDIKGCMRSHAELLEASGYGNRPEDFDDLIRILDSEIRLITPTDPEGKETDDDSVTQPRAGQKYFQLTHDYLVHSLRNWLTRKQKETRRGRAELKLSDTAVTWNAKPENRFLPSWWEHLTIRLLTDRQKWTDPQRKMMAKARQVHGIRMSMVAVLLVGLTFAGIGVRSAILTQQRQTLAQLREKEHATRAEELMASLLKAEITQVSAVISELTAYRDWADPLLRARLKETADGSPEKLHLALALLPVDESHLDYLSQQIPVCTLPEFPVLRETLLPHKDKLTEALWQVVTDEQLRNATRFQAAAALAEYAPDDERWQTKALFVAEHLTSAVSSVYLDPWRELLRPASQILTEPFTAIHGDRNRSEKQRETAAFVLSDYLRDDPVKLADVILVADELVEFSFLIAATKPYASAMHRRLLDEMQAAMPSELDKTNHELSEPDQQLRDNHWKRQSLAAVTLVHLGLGDDVWSLLEFTPNPSLRSYIIHYLGRLGTDHNTLAARLHVERDVSIRRALIQSLGGLDASRIPVSDRNRIAEQLALLYVNDLDSGIHASASWTLRQWDVALPELPVGEPVETDARKQQLVPLTAEVAGIRQRIISAEAELPIRQAAWERQLCERPRELPSSFSEQLVAHYPLDESEGMDVANIVDGQPAANYVGSDPCQHVPGVVGDALQVFGNGDFVTCGQIFSPDATEAFSYGGWYFNENRVELSYLTKYDHKLGYRGFGLFLRGDALICNIVNGEPNSHIRVLAKPPSELNWHHVFVTYDGSAFASGVTIYIDGNAVSMTVDADRLNSGSIQNALSLAIGHGETPALIDDVRIYNRLLSEQEILQLYESGLRALAAVPVETRAPEQQALLSAAYRPQDEPLRRLKSQLAAAETALREAHWKGVRRWYLNGQGQTMVVIPRPASSGESAVDHSFAIASHEVTVAEFGRYQNQHEVEHRVAPTEDCPVHYVRWYEAAAYCNWLSKQEGIPEDQWVYQPNVSGQYADGMLIRENAVELSGYRMPTEAEWEFACRAGSSGSYHFGEPLPLLGRYAVSVLDSPGRTQSVESLLPNTTGLFDMHGNLWEWLQTPLSGSMSPVQQDVHRLLGGGSFIHLASDLVSSAHSTNLPANRYIGFGFRPARTHKRFP